MSAENVTRRGSRSWEGGFTETTSYRDYAISRDLFHWESQSTIREDTPTGRRYTQQAANGWRFLMFVRETRDDAFVALGGAPHEPHRRAPDGESGAVRDIRRAAGGVASVPPRHSPQLSCPSTSAGASLSLLRPAGAATTGR